MMKSKLFARILCIVLCAVLVGSALLVAIPMMTGKAATFEPVKGGDGTVTEDYVSLRSGAGKNYETVAVLRVNTRVTFEDDALYNKEWYKVKELVSNKTGYIMRDFVAADAPAVSAIKLCATKAYTYVGCQYAFWQTGASKPAWSSSDTSVASIDSNGILTAKKAGTATITAKEGSSTATCVFTVRSGSSTGISSSSMTLELGKTSKLTAKTSGVSWFSSNTNVAAVSGGTVTAKALGYATISAYTSSGASTCLVHVVQAQNAKKITLCAAKASTYIGCQYAFWQTGAANPVWSSSNTSVAVIDQYGILTAKNPGTTTVTVKDGSDSATCAFTVRSGYSTGISPGSITLEEGKTATLTAKTSGVNWFSSNPNVASVSGGVVTAKSDGYATISAYTSNGASTCLVRVEKPKPKPVITLCATKASTYVGCQYAFWATGVSSPSWTSSDTAVATIDKNGILTAKKAGTTTISCSEGGETASCSFTVRSGVSTKISDSKMTVIKGTTGKLTAQTVGVNWFSSNPNVASVSGGIVTAKAAGYATISAYTSSGASTCLVTVVSSAQTSDIKLCAYQASSYVGCQYAFWQTGAENPVWASSNPNVASMDTSGVLTMRTAGTVTISCTENNKVSSCKFTVKSGTATGISPANLTLEEGKLSQLTSKTSGVSWFSSNSNVATVSSSGIVTAKSAGYATISAYNSGGASTCLVKVTKASEPEIPQTVPRGYVTADYVNLRSGPGTNYSIVTLLPENTEFTFLSEDLFSGSWYYIQLDNGTKGYLSSYYVEKIIPPTITLCAKTASTYVGCQYAFWQTGAEYPEWKSSDVSVATVDQNGVVTAKKAGTTYISATENGGVGTCRLTVKNGASTGISSTSLTLAAGKTSKLTAKTSGVKWFSSNPAVASVSDGTVTAKSMGYATISAYTSSGASTCLVKVTQGTGTIKFLASSASTYTGCKYAVPCTGANGASWTSSNTSVATVDSNGVVTAKASGSATIKATNSVSSASIKITVYSGSSTGISLSSSTIAAGKSILLYADSYVDWYSSNTNIATVNDGVVDTKSEGYVTISAYNSYGASTCLLHVTAPDNIRFVYASPNCATKNATVTFKAITDKSRTAVQFVVSNGSESYTVSATSKTADGSTYIWSGSKALSTPGKWTVKAYSKTASTGFATTSVNGEGEVFVTNSTSAVTTVLGERRASDKVIEMIAYFEGFLPTLTGDYITGDPTIGHGKVIWENEQFYNNLTRNEAYAYLYQTVNEGPYTTVTNDFLTSNNAKFNQQQFDALVCFAYNVGAYALTSDSIFKTALLGGSSVGTVTAGGAGYINTSGVNLRSGPDTDYSIVTTMSYNTAFTFVDAKLYSGSWYKIKLTSTGQVGYVYADYASATGAAKDLAKTDKATFTQRLLQYHHASGDCYIGLLWRRVDEVEMFFYGDYETDGEDNKYGLYFRCSNNPSFGIG